MHILITGAGGMIGRKLAERLLSDGSLLGSGITKLTLFDLTAPDFASGDIEIDGRAGDFGERGVPESLIEGRPDVIFHLASIVSGEAEVEFEKGYRINLDGTRAMLEAIKAEGDYCPRFVFASSIAVFGAPFPDVISDDYQRTPLTSYGTQKAIDELLLTDFTRKGFVDGVGIRFPTIVVRPGKPNLAASGFFSNIIREPLNGEEAVLPVSREVVHWMASPRSAVGFCLRAVEITAQEIGPHRNLTMPGLAISVGEMIEALERVAGGEVTARIREEEDPAIATIVANWPSRFEAARATALGFEAESDFDAIIRAHIEDEMGGRVG